MQSAFLDTFLHNLLQNSVRTWGLSRFRASGFRAFTVIRLRLHHVYWGIKIWIKSLSVWNPEVRISCTPKQSGCLIFWISESVWNPDIFVCISDNFITNQATCETTTYIWILFFLVYTLNYICGLICAVSFLTNLYALYCKQFNFVNFPFFASFVHRQSSKFFELLLYYFKY